MFLAVASPCSPIEIDLHSAGSPTINSGCIELPSTSAHWNRTSALDLQSPYELELHWQTTLEKNEDACPKVSLKPG